MTPSDNGTVTASRHHNAKAYQKVKARAKARSAAVTLAGQDIGGLPVRRAQGKPPIPERVRRGRADRGFKFFCETYFPHLFTLD